MNGAGIRGTRHERAVLGLLLDASEDAPYYPARLGRDLGLTDSVIHPLLRRLERAGLVERRDDPTPATELKKRPPRYVLLTDTGRYYAAAYHRPPGDVVDGDVRHETSTARGSRFRLGLPVQQR